MTKTYLLMVISEESVCRTSSLTPLTADLAGTVCKVSHSSIADEPPVHRTTTKTYRPGEGCIVVFR